MNMNRKIEPGGDAPDPIDGDALEFRYATSVADGCELTWTVWCEVAGQLVRADAPTATQAWDRAIILANKVRRANDATAEGPVAGQPTGSRASPGSLPTT